MALNATFRDAIKALSPPWLAEYWGERLMYIFGVVQDAAMQATQDGGAARFPSKAPDDALQFIGADRGIARGFAEPGDSYIARLLLWLDSWKHAGSAYGLLPQLWGYFIPFYIDMLAVTNWELWYELPAGTLGDPRQAITLTAGSGWDWDGLATAWWRFWVVLYPASVTPAPFATDGNWGDAGDWGDGGTWGTTATVEQVSEVRAIVRQWSAAHNARGDGASGALWIIIAFDNASFHIGNANLPDGAWGPWSKTSAGVRVQSRLSTARYWDG